MVQLVMGNPKSEYFTAWQNLELKRAESKLTQDMNDIGNQMNARGLYRSGPHIVALIAEAKLVTEQLVSLMFVKAEEDGLPLEVGLAISKTIIEFLVRWRPLFESRRSKINYNAPEPLLREIDRRILEFQAEINEQCRVAELRLIAFSTEASDKQSTLQLKKQATKLAAGQVVRVPNRPPSQRQNAENFLQEINPERWSDKVESLTAEMLAKTKIKVSNDTMRRAILRLSK